MTEPRTLSREKLEQMIGETETSLTDLKAELTRRDQAAQHREIDHLEEHMNSAETGLRSVRDFFRLLTAELRKSEF